MSEELGRGVQDQEEGSREWGPGARGQPETGRGLCTVCLSPSPINSNVIQCRKAPCKKGPYGMVYPPKIFLRANIHQ